MRTSRAYIILLSVVSMLLLASCGKQQSAKKLVKEFVKEYATQEIDITSFSDLDSTRVISDTLLLNMRKTAKNDPLFKSDFQFTAERDTPTLLFIRMRYHEPDDTLEQSRTFYFNRELTGIVAFK